MCLSLHEQQKKHKHTHRYTDTHTHSLPQYSTQPSAATAAGNEREREREETRRPQQERAERDSNSEERTSFRVQATDSLTAAVSLQAPVNPIRPDPVETRPSQSSSSSSSVTLSRSRNKLQALPEKSPQSIPSLCVCDCVFVCPPKEKKPTHDAPATTTTTTTAQHPSTSSRLAQTGKKNNQKQAKMSSADKNSEVEVENVAAAEEKAETKEVKGVKRPADVSTTYYYYPTPPSRFHPLEPLPPPFPLTFLPFTARCC